MCDVARALEREDEVVWRLRAPGREALRVLQAIEGAVDLNGGEVLSGKRELSLPRKARGVEPAAPRCIRPAGDADADPACHAPPPGVCGTTDRLAVGSGAPAAPIFLQSVVSVFGLFCAAVRARASPCSSLQSSLARNGGLCAAGGWLAEQVLDRAEPQRFPCTHAHAERVVPRSCLLASADFGQFGLGDKRMLKRLRTPAPPQTLVVVPCNVGTQSLSQLRSFLPYP